MIRVNHSCAPNVGMGGNVLLVAMREIAAGEELTIDYALFLGDPGFAMDCRCGTAACRGVVRGTDWMHAGLRSATGDGFPGGCSRRSHKAGTSRAGSLRKNPGPGIPARPCCSTGVAVRVEHLHLATERVRRMPGANDWHARTLQHAYRPRCRQRQESVGPRHHIVKEP